MEKLQAKEPRSLTAAEGMAGQGRQSYDKTPDTARTEKYLAKRMDDKTEDKMSFPKREDPNLTDYRLSKIHPLTLWLYGPCKENLDHYQKLDMKVEAHLFKELMRQIEEDFGIPLSPSPS